MPLTTETRYFRAEMCPGDPSVQHLIRVDISTTAESLNVTYPPAIPAEQIIPWHFCPKYPS